jgi:hypothetical protein
MTPASQIAPKSRYRDMFARRLGRACPTRRRSLALPAWLHDHRLAVVAALDAAGVGYWELVLQMQLHSSPRAKTLQGPGGSKARFAT